MALEESILKSTKKILGLDDAYKAFDLDVLTHINTSLFTLAQLGIGPAEGFLVEDEDAEWEEFTGGVINLNAVKTYVYLKVRMLFDPPGTPHHIKAIEDQIRELEHRLLLEKEVPRWSQATTLP